MDKISVVTPTYNRPAPLARALASLSAQQIGGDLEVELVVVDNSADANAREMVTAAAATSRFPIVFVSETRAGVAHARNAGTAAARGRWVAFLDDDEEADPRWLASLARVARATGAAAVFGPIEARAEGGRDIGPFALYFERRIVRRDGADITDLAAYLGTNNSLFDRAACLAAPQPFDPRLNESGGEDSLLLQKLALSGKKFHLSAEARVVEWAPERRLTWAYVKKRKFLSGQIRVFVQKMARPRAYGALACWMAVGLAQTVIFGAATVVFAPFGQEKRERMAAQLFGGLGKIFWASRFRPVLYGRGLVS
jgi:glycosyltransferase involved in cell wall biosynthesis